MTNEQLDEIEKLYAAATPGPWSQEVWQGNDDTGGWAAVGPHQESTDCICESEEDRENCNGEYCADERSQNDEEQAWKDAVFIRAMREYTLPLVKALREARAEVERLKESVANLDALYVSRTDALREAEAEVERLREVVRKVHTLASGMLIEVEWTIDRIDYPIRKIHKLTGEAP